MSRIARFLCFDNVSVFTLSLFNRTRTHRGPLLLTLAFIQMLSASWTHAAAQAPHSAQPQTSPPAITVRYTPSYNLNTVSVGATGSSTPVTFTFGSPGEIGQPLVVTQGAANLDFVDDGTGTCTTNGSSHPYNTGDSCTVNVTFTPKSWGPRYGAVELQDTSGNLIATVYLQGIGKGPQVSFLPGTMTALSLPSPLLGSNAIAIDGLGNLYVAESISPFHGTSVVIKETWTNGSWKQSTVMTGLDQPLGVAVDGAGRVYVADISSYQPYVAIPTAAGDYTTSSLSQPSTGFRISAIATDGSGNIYFADESNGLQKLVYQGSTGYTQTTIDSTFYTISLAVDTAGNIYFSNVFPAGGGSPTFGLFKDTPNDGTYTQSAIRTVDSGSLAVDANGNVYTYSNGELFKETFSNGTYTESSVSFSSMDRGLVIDSQGNALTLDNSPTNPAGITKLDISDTLGLTFATTAYGSTSSDSPKAVTLTNTGNDTLNIPVLSSGGNPAIAASFTLGSSAASPCPVVASGASSPGTLAVGASCDFSISFSPQFGGPITGSLVLTDGGPSQAVSDDPTQTISLSGSGTNGPAPITWTTPSPVFSGTPLGSAQLNATSTAAGTFTYSPAAGTVLSVGTQTLTANFTPTDTTTYTSSTATVSLKVEDFTVTPQSNSATASAGGAATYTLAVATSSGDPFPQAITFAVTGLPSGASATFSPSSIAAGAGATNVTLTVTAANSAAMQSRPFPFRTGALPIALGLLLLPFGGARRKFSRRVAQLICLAAIAIASTALFGIAGCGSGGGGGTTNTTLPPQSYPLTVTASSGSLSHSAALNLTVN